MKATEHKETGEKMHIYEVSYLIVPSITEEKVTDEVAKIHAGLKAEGASVISEEFPQHIELAYSMEHTMDAKKHTFTEAYFGWIKFELPVASLANIKVSFDKNPNIIRHLLIKTVRESTLYTAKVPGVAAKTGDKPEGDAPADAVETKVASGNEIDKSIDALVIS